MIIDILVELLYIIVVALIWVMLVYQVVLTASGYLYSRRKLKGSAIPDDQLPPLTIIIPARNEERVIAETVACMFRLDYPHDKLEVIIINDGSTDRTGAILAAVNDPRLKVITIPLAESGQGKSRVLNIAVKQAAGELIAIYDADNRPEQNALKILVKELLADRQFIAAIGKFRTINRNTSIMTRFVNIETQAFQWIIQAGRSYLFDIAVLPGTNFVIWKNIVLEAGGWDHSALTEDAELSARLYQAGHEIKFVPQAATWEQEPDTVRVWLKQRTRWVRGNNYLLVKLLKEFGNFKNKAIGIEFLAFSMMYYLFFIAMLLSNIFFALGLLNIVTIRIQGPFLELWIAAFLLFVSEIVHMLSREPNEDSASNIFYVMAMYFTYCQLWLIVVVSAFIKDFIKKEKAVWYKTERTAEIKSAENK